MLHDLLVWARVRVSRLSILSALASSVLTLTLALVATAQTAETPAIDQQCLAQYQAEQYAKAATTCEQAARGHDHTARAQQSSGDLKGSHAEAYLGATLRVLAAWSNYVGNNDSLALDEVDTAIDVFKMIASSKIDPPGLVAEAKSSLQDAQKQLAIMKASP